MAINLRCTKCKSDSKLGSKECRGCGVRLAGKNKKYRVVVKLSSGKRKSRIIDTLETAKKVEVKFKTESIEIDVFNIQKAPYLSDIWDKYIEWAKTNKKTWKEDETRWKYHVEPHLKGLKMNKITVHDIETVLNTMKGSDNRQGKPYSPQTVKHVLTLQKRLFNWAIRRDLYSGPNPCIKIKVPKFDNRVNNTLSKTEVDRLLTVLDSWENQRGALVVKFALYTGKRRGEIFSLKWEDVDLADRLMTFHGINTKSGKSQTLPMNQKTYEIILQAKKLKNCEQVFSSQYGPYNPKGYDKVWRRIRKKAGITIRFHDLRHTYASYLASSGKVDIYTLKELLGHSSIEMTQRYAHLINGALRKAACVVDEVF